VLDEPQPPATTRSCISEIVGYGADPVRDYRVSVAPLAMIRGNHDKVRGDRPPTTFNDVARSSIEWTMTQLTPAQLTYLAELPKAPVSSRPIWSLPPGRPSMRSLHL
jgi:hypothetical protein